MAANSALLCVLVKLLQPLQSKLIICPAILRDADKPVARYTQLLVPGREVVLALENDKGRDSLLYRVDIYDDTSLLLVALLYCLWSAAMLRACDNSSCRYDAHDEARLIEVVRVFIQDAMPSFGTLDQAEPALNYLRILAESSLMFVLSIMPA
jgi:hypothetical protein